MRSERASGVLLHPTSLPGPYGIGDLGGGAERFLDWLAGSGCGLWQVLPLGPTGYGDSPYQCFSSFAGNPYLISPEILLADGLLRKSDLADMPEGDPGRVDYGAISRWKPALLERAFRRFEDRPGALAEACAAYRSENQAWLEEYALYTALKESHAGASWDSWGAELAARHPGALAAARAALAEPIRRQVFLQFLFDRQWTGLHARAAAAGIRIIGDLPIFAAYDSADVWSRPDLFLLDEAGRPTVVAGVPPDYFSPTGQRWGNPLYRWEAHRAEGFAWWRARVAAALARVDLLRIDHFRGFSACWEIPASSATAEQGRWAAAPGAELFEAVQADLGRLPILAEDLGVITPEVTALRERFSLPGMKVLQFAFSGPDNPFLPHRHPENCVVYTGTHDNDTSLGWYQGAPEAEREFARRYLGTQGQDIAWDLIRAAWRSPAVFALAPLQDLLSLDSAARMNFPSRLGGNWEWRAGEAALSPELQARVKELNWLFERENRRADTRPE